MPPSTTVYQSGDAEWFRKCPELTSGCGRSARLRARDGGPGPARRASASRLGAARPVAAWKAGRGSAARQILTQGRGPAFLRGRLIHAWFELVAWLDEGRPDAAALRRRADESLAGTAPGELDVDQQMERFQRWLDLPVFAELLSRRRYQHPQHLGFPPEVQLRLAERPFTATVQNERGFALRDGEQLLTGFIDRLVLLHQDTGLVAAEILDFKTDAIPPGDSAAIAERVQFYRPQMEAYRRARTGVDRTAHRAHPRRAGLRRGRSGLPDRLTGQERQGDGQGWKWRGQGGGLPCRSAGRALPCERQGVSPPVARWTRRSTVGLTHPRLSWCSPRRLPTTRARTVASDVPRRLAAGDAAPYTGADFRAVRRGVVLPALPFPPSSYHGGSAMSSKPEIHRRQFVAGSAAAIGAFTIIPRHVLGQPGQPSANNKLNVASVGVGGMGSGDIRNVPTENVVAICDVDANHAAERRQELPRRQGLQRFPQDAGDPEGHRRGDGRHAGPQPCRGHDDGPEDGQARVLPEAADAQRARVPGDRPRRRRKPRSPRRWATRARPAKRPA